jgi:hypothetical protein
MTYRENVQSLSPTAYIDMTDNPMVNLGSYGTPVKHDIGTVAQQSIIAGPSVLDGQDGVVPTVTVGAQMQIAIPVPGTFRSANFTMTGWVKRNSAGSGSGTLMSIAHPSWSNGSSLYSRTQVNTGGSFRVATRAPGGNYGGDQTWHTSLDVTQLSEWSHITLRRTGSTLELLRNGNLVWSTTSATTLGSSSVDDDRFVYWRDGTINQLAEAAFWDRALTDEEIGWLANGFPTTPQPSWSLLESGLEVPLSLDGEYRSAFHTDAMDALDSLEPSVVVDLTQDTVSVQGGTLVSDTGIYTGYARRYDSNKQTRISLAQSVSTSQPHTVVMWLKMNPDDHVSGAMLTSNAQDGVTNVLSSILGNGAGTIPNTLYIAGYSGAGSALNDGTTRLATGDWAMLAWSSTSATDKVAYMDNTSGVTATHASRSATTASTLYVGSVRPGNETKAEFSYVAIFDRVLTVGEIETVLSAGPGVKVRSLGGPDILTYPPRRYYDVAPILAAADAATNKSELAAAANPMEPTYGGTNLSWYTSTTTVNGWTCDSPNFDDPGFVESFKTHIDQTAKYPPAFFASLAIPQIMVAKNCRYTDGPHDGVSFYANAAGVWVKPYQSPQWLFREVEFSFHHEVAHQIWYKWRNAEFAAMKTKWTALTPYVGEDWNQNPDQHPPGFLRRYSSKEFEEDVADFMGAVMATNVQEFVAEKVATDPIAAEKISDIKAFFASKSTEMAHPLYYHGIHKEAQ